MACPHQPAAVRRVRRARRVARLASLVLAITLGLPAARARPEVGGKPAVVTATLMAPREEVFLAVKQALSAWRMRKADLAEGVVKTDWEERRKLSETFRGRVVALLEPEGYVTKLTVRHEKQRRMDELRPTLGGPAPEWREWDGDHALAQAVVASVQDALGLEPPPVDLSRLGDRPAGPALVHADAGCVVTPEAGARIRTLVERRRDLVREIQAMDARILEAVYGGNYQAIAAEMDGLKARKTVMEGQVTDIDREILSLVLGS